VLEKIGVGGMATVYKARHLTFNELRALKIVSSKLTDDPLFLKRFKTEAIVTRKLKHHNAVRVEDFDETEDGRPFIVMEYVEGKNLRHVVHEAKRLPVERALEIARQTAAALSAAHQLGITHRDIKPDNILLVQLPDGSEQVKVLDFGIAKLKEGSIEHTGSYTPTQTGMVMGTPQYISPEQALGRSGEEIDGRADIYSLGVVLYEMLCGELPFRSDTPIGLLMHHISTLPTPPHALNPELPPAISQMLLKCLEKDRDNRYQSADEFIEALSRPELTATTEAFGSNTMAGAPNNPAPVPAKTPIATAPLTPPPLARVAVSTPAAAAAKPAAVATPPGVPTPATAPLPTPAPPTPVMTTPIAPPQPRVARQRVNVPTIMPVPAPRSHGLLYAALGAAIALLIGAGYLLMRQPSAPQPQPAQAVTAPVDPTKVVAQIELLYNSSPVLQKHGIIVGFVNGVATLTGSVDNQSESELAAALASNVAGVSSVNNQLAIQPGAENSEHEAAAKAEKAAAEQHHAEAKPTPAEPAKPAASQPVEQQSEPTPSNASTTPASAEAGDSTDPTEGSGWTKDQRVQALVAQGYRDMEARRGRKAYFEFQKALELDPGNRQAQAGLQRLEQMRRQQQFGQPPQ
jgi:serine/threonine protein kinase